MITSIGVLAAVLTFSAAIFKLPRTQLLPSQRFNTQLAGLQMLVPKTAIAGKQFEIDIHIENRADNPLVGLLWANPPSWGIEDNSKSLSESFNVSAKAREVIKWNINIPKGVKPGKYKFIAYLQGTIADGPVFKYVVETINVK
ncbi:MAG TPA: hypothetical protein VGL70_09600 [Candidatus Binatia bacterium]|jgi:hypothetical protein